MNSPIFSNKLSFLLLLFLSVGLVACDNSDDDEPTPDDNSDANATLELRLDHTYANADLTAGTTYSLATGEQLQFSSFQYILSDFKLFRSNGDTVHLPEAYFIVDALADNGNVQSLNLGELPTGDYTGMTFAVGLPYDLNHIDPTTLADDHPLNNPGMHWGWNPEAGYKFWKIEGSIDSVNGEAGNLDNALLYHIATDDLLRYVTSFQDYNFSIDEGSNNLAFYAKVEKAFEGIETEVLNNFSSHTTGNKAIVESIADNRNNVFCQCQIQ